MATAVTRKGQVTIPKPLRDRLGLSVGSLVSFEMSEAGDVVVMRAETARPDSRFARFRGMVQGGMSTDEIMALTRGED